MTKPKSRFYARFLSYQRAPDRLYSEQQPGELGWWLVLDREGKRSPHGWYADQEQAQRHADQLNRQPAAADTLP